MSTQTQTRALHTIANEIKKDWGTKVNYAAKPYLSALSQLDTVNDQYGYDSAKSMVNYFLCNAGSWRGETAKRVKLELKAMVK